MNKFFKVLSVSCLSLLMGMMMIMPASAEEANDPVLDSILSIEDVEFLDSYVKVENNKLVLNDNAYFELNSEQYKQISEIISISNQVAIENGFDFDVDTKAFVTNRPQSRVAGCNGWGTYKATIGAGVFVKIDQNTTRLMVGAGLTGAIAYLGTIVTGNVSAVVIAAMAGYVIKELSGQAINHGIIVRHEFARIGFTWEWQYAPCGGHGGGSW